jgi:hypothetical protein
MITLVLYGAGACIPWVLAIIIHRVTTKGGDS